MHTHTNTQWVFHFAVSCHCRYERLPSSPSLSTHPFMAVAGLKRRGRTGDVETDGCWHQPKTRVWQKWAQREAERDYPIWAWFCSTSQQQTTDSENKNKGSCRLNTLLFCTVLIWFTVLASQQIFKVTMWVSQFECYDFIFIPSSVKLYVQTTNRMSCPLPPLPTRQECFSSLSFSLYMSLCCLLIIRVGSGAQSGAVSCYLSPIFYYLAASS